MGFGSGLWIANISGSGHFENENPDLDPEAQIIIIQSTIRIRNTAKQNNEINPYRELISVLKFSRAKDPGVVFLFLMRIK